jgi:hypothetical protein
MTATDGKFSTPAVLFLVLCRLLSKKEGVSFVVRVPSAHEAKANLVDHFQPIAFDPFSGPSSPAVAIKTDIDGRPNSKNMKHRNNKGNKTIGYPFI